MIVIVRENAQGVFVSREEAEADWFIVVNDTGQIRVAPNGMVDTIQSNRVSFDSIDKAYEYITAK
jgi:hypothetical protein